LEDRLFWAVKAKAAPATVCGKCPPSRHLRKQGRSATHDDPQARRPARHGPEPTVGCDSI